MRRGVSSKKTMPLPSTTALLAMFVAVVISLVLTYGLPTWASITVALAGVVIVSIGGGALLAKVVGFCAVVVLAILLLRRHQRRQPLRHEPADEQWPTVTEARMKAPEAQQHRTERRAA